MNHRQFLRGLFACAAGLLLSGAAQAQAFRTYLSPTGVDGPACGLAAPCRLLPAALAAVGDGGEVWMLDSANYNTAPVNINKSVTILAVPGALGSVVALAGNAINIATPGVKVALRNLVIVPFMNGGGTNGIVMTAGAALTVENCVVANLPGNGIQVSTAANVWVTNTIIRDNGVVGLHVQNGVRATVTRATISGSGNAGILVQGSTTADIGDSTINANLHGVAADSTSGSDVLRVSLFKSRIVGNSDRGAVAQALIGGAVVSLIASDNVVSNNGTGISALGAGSRVLASGNTVSNNNIGLENTGLFESASDNAVRNNTAPSLGTISPIPKI